VAANVNHLWFADTTLVQTLRQEGTISQDLGWDTSLALTYRPWLTQNIVFRANPQIRPPGPLDPNFVPAEIDYGFKYSELKQAVGVAVQWLAPLGVFRFSYAMPLNDKRGDTLTRWGDEVEGFQFSIGQAF